MKIIIFITVYAFLIYENVAFAQCDTVEAQFSYSVSSVDYFSAVSFQNLSINDTSWYWNFGDGTTSTDENPLHNYTFPGFNVICTDDVPTSYCTADYRVCLIAYNECSSDTICDTLTHIGFCCNLNVIGELKATDLEIFPNPSKSQLIIDISKVKHSELKLDLVDMHGKLVFQGYPLNNYVNVIDITSVEASTYIVRIHSSKDIVLISRIIIE